MVVYIKKGPSELRVKLDKALQSMHDDGSYQHMLLALDTRYNNIP